MKRLKSKTEAENGQEIFHEQASVQPSETTLTVVKDDVQPQQEQQQPAQPAEHQQPIPQPEAKPEVKTLTVTEKLAALKELDKIAQQRTNLISMIEKLSSFEIKQHDAAELNEGSPYKHCELTISDDNGDFFSTRNPNLIAANVAHLLIISGTRKEELESLLVFPAA